MSAAAPDDWEDVVGTLRSDLEVVADDDADEADVSAAIEEVWSIVDAFEERVGAVDVGGIGDALGVDVETSEDPLDASSIPTAFVVDDPGRAASLSRLVGLVALDGATDYDVGRLWNGDRGGAEGGGDRPPDDSDSESATSDDRADSTEGASGSADSSGSTDANGSDDDAEGLRADLGEALSELRGQIQDAREGLQASTASESESATGDASERDATGSEETNDDGSRSTSSSGVGSSPSSKRSATAFSTVPSNRRDVGGATGFSTVPGRRTGSRSSSGTSSGSTITDDGEDGYDGDEDDGTDDDG